MLTKILTDTESTNKITQAWDKFVTWTGMNNGQAILSACALVVVGVVAIRFIYKRVKKAVR